MRNAVFVVFITHFNKAERPVEIQQIGLRTDADALTGEQTIATGDALAHQLLAEAFAAEGRRGQHTPDRGFGVERAGMHRFAARIDHAQVSGEKP